MKKIDLILPWLLVCIATVISLFFSEVRHQKPCNLCWYQRILMFPLAVILGIAAFRRAYRIVYYVLPLSLIGLGISIYHLFLLRFCAGSDFCPACTLKALSPNPYTFPLLSFLAFLILNALLIWIAVKHRGSKKL